MWPFEWNHIPALFYDSKGIVFFYQSVCFLSMVFLIQKKEWMFFKGFDAQEGNSVAFSVNYICWDLT